MVTSGFVIVGSDPDEIRRLVAGVILLGWILNLLYRSCNPYHQ
jgi:hypothetical protein